GSIVDDYWRSGALVRLTHQLPDDLLDQVLKLARRHADDYWGGGAYRAVRDAVGSRLSSPADVGPEPPATEETAAAVEDIELRQSWRDEALDRLLPAYELEADPATALARARAIGNQT